MITVVLPVHNGEKYIYEAVDSVINQSFTDWKLIISDNCSTDETHSICKKILKLDKRISYIRHQVFLTSYDHFMRTIEFSSDEFFIWIAADDIWRNDFLNLCISQMKYKSIGLTFTRVINVSPNKKINRKIDKISLIPSRYHNILLLKYLYFPEQFGKANIIYGLFRTKLLKKYIKRYKLNDHWGTDMCFVLGYISEYGLLIDHSYAFYKRLSNNESYSFNKYPLLFPLIPLSKIFDYICDIYKCIKPTLKITFIINFPFYLLYYLFHTMFCYLIAAAKKLKKIL